MKKFFAVLVLLAILYIAAALLPVQHIGIHYVVNLDVYNVDGKPSVSASFIDKLLCKYRSPACGLGQAFYDESEAYNIDAAYALAFFLQESTFGRYGAGRDNRSIGNLRCIPDTKCIGGYARFPSWRAGIEAWYRLIAGYVRRGLVTVDQIVPVYAPGSDGNDEQHYKQVIKSEVTRWRSGEATI